MFFFSFFFFLFCFVSSVSVSDAALAGFIPMSGMGWDGMGE